MVLVVEPRATRISAAFFGDPVSSDGSGGQEGRSAVCSASESFPSSIINPGEGLGTSRTSESGRLTVLGSRPPGDGFFSEGEPWLRGLPTARFFSEGEPWLPALPTAPPASACFFLGEGDRPLGPGFLGEEGAGELGFLGEEEAGFFGDVRLPLPRAVLDLVSGLEDIVVFFRVRCSIGNIME